MSELKPLPNLLFVTPSLPSPLGTGSMLRAAMALEALHKRFRVHILNLNVWSWGAGRPSFVLSRAAAYAEVPAARGEIDTSGLAQQFFPGVQFAAIHTFKLLMARVTMGIIAGLPSPQPYLVLDLDDDECARSAGLLALIEQDNDLPAIQRAQTDLAQLRMLERMMAPRFQALALAGVTDCHVLRSRYPRVPVHHLPNAIDLPENVASNAAPEPTPTANLLFVGALYYAPNADGVCFFVDRVFPILQALLDVPVTLRIVGADPLRRVSALAQNPSVTIHPNVPDVAPFYYQADLCIVPLRAGSGTRIKIIEAFSFRRPVVSTYLGAEGLAVINNTHLLLADDPEPFAQACVSLLQDPATRKRIIDNAYTWVSQNHSIANVETAMASIYQPVLQPHA